MSKCSKCGAELSAGAKFCEECGTRVPQTKPCPKCGAQLKPEAKFCMECGYSFLAKGTPPAAGAVSIGDKNVIAGDVVGEAYKISGNATIVKNEDETKKMVRCHVCGRNMPITEAITCVKCGEHTCEDCMDMRVKSCKTCVEAAVREQDNVYRQAVVRALEDGVLTLVERRELNALQKQLGLSDLRATEIEDQVRANGAQKKSQTAALTSFEKMSLNRAADLFYGQGDAESAFDEIEPIFKRHPDDEEVVTLYADVLLKKDSDVAREYLDSLRVDIPGVKIVRIDLSCKDGDFAEVEMRLDEAERLWPDSVRVHVRRIAFCMIMYMHSKDKSYLNQARELSENIAEGETKLERSEVEAIIRMVMNASGEECDDLTEEECEERDLYFDVASGGQGHDDDSSDAESSGDDDEEYDEDNDDGGDEEDDEEDDESSDEVVVSADGDADYTTIEEGVDHVSDGGTVIVKGGTYKEHFNLEKDVLIVGKKGCTVVIEMPDDVPEDNPCSIEVSESANVTFRNITFNNTFSGDGPNGSLAVGDECVLLVESCRFVGMGPGVLTCCKAKVTLTDCEFCYVFGPVGLFGLGEAVVVMNDTKFDHDKVFLSENVECTMNRCSIRNSDSDGIVIDDSAVCVFNDCKIEQCTGNGVHVKSKDASVTVKNCTITDCEWGVYIVGEHKRWLKANKCSDFNFVYKNDELFRFENEGVGKCSIIGACRWSCGNDNYIKAERFNNDTGTHSGDLMVTLWFSKTEYTGGSIEGIRGLQGYLGALSDGYGFPDKTVACEKLAEYRQIRSGDEYYPVAIVNESTIEPDGTEHRYIVGWMNFKKYRWN